MLRISFQTLRARRGTLAGAFVAIWLAVTLAYGTGLLMDGALSAPGPGRFAAAEAVVRAKPRRPDDARAAARRRARARVEGAVGDVAFPVGAWARRSPARHRAAARPRLVERRADALPPDLGPRAVRPARGRRRRAAAPPARACASRRRRGEATYRVTGTVRGAAGPATLFFADAVAARLSGAPGQGQRDRRPRAARPSACAMTSPRCRRALAPSRPTSRPPPRLEVARPRARGRRRRRRPARRRPRGARRDLRRRWAGSPARSRCSSSPARSRSRSPSGGARSRCCARSAPRRTRCGG